ncbi:MAG: MFS transporter [Opitutus sp.]|nr:MFS transporter [Opitutus sp.]
MPHPVSPAAPRGLWKIIGAASAGTLIEWYDFYVFGSLATVLSAHFFPSGNETAALLNTLAVFATGFVVRPFGALVFGRLGDRVGRKHTFLLTLLLMGGSTFAIGLLPTFAQAGVAAPLLLVLLRLVQGLSIGGEYGGAATYVAEHAPDARRGFYTGFLQTTASLGLIMSLGVVLGFRTVLGRAEFEAWGWRLPFLLSILLVLLSWFVRRRMDESPLFAKAKAAGRLSASPVLESFTRWENVRAVLLALFGFVAGHAVVWYTGHFYVLFFLQRVAKVDFVAANSLVTWALVASAPLYVVWGALSDKVGRKPIVMAGCLLGAAGFWPVYHGLVSAAAAGNTGLLFGLVLLQMSFGTMTYGPLAAWLVELFPTRIRYTALSLPYHLGIGVLGGLTPFVATKLVAVTGNAYAGLWYPMAFAALAFVVGTLLLRERHGQPLE